MKKDSVLDFEKYGVKESQMFLTAGLIRASNVVMHVVTAHRGNRGFRVSTFIWSWNHFPPPMSIS